MITISDLKKTYQSGETQVRALRGISMEIVNGEFLSIAGPSGSGKTTLLNLIGCLDVADDGGISFDGTPVKSKSKKELAELRRHKIGFIFQSFNLIPVLTAYENIAFPLNLLSISEKEIRERTMDILQEVGLDGLEDRRPAQLSGGQQQRVAIARSLVKSPELVLADEPTANLDSKNGEAILSLMENLNGIHHTTFIFSTHDKLVMDHAHRLVTLRDGQIIGDDVRKGAAARGDET
jgi:putative ABC transport system ATP-binding protein